MPINSWNENMHLSLNNNPYEKQNSIPSYLRKSITASGPLGNKSEVENCLQEVYPEMILASAPVEKGKPPPCCQCRQREEQSCNAVTAKAPEEPMGALELDGPEKKIGLNPSTLTSITHWILASSRKVA